MKHFHIENMVMGRFYQNLYSKISKDWTLAFMELPYYAYGDLILKIKKGYIEIEYHKDKIIPIRLINKDSELTVQINQEELTQTLPFYLRAVSDPKNNRCTVAQNKFVYEFFTLVNEFYYVHMINRIRRLSKLN